MSEPKKKRVVVAMSGGVDSSVAALLLKQQGYEVIGISMKLWSYDVEAKYGCCTPEDLYDARKVAAQLNIPYYVFNMQDDFKKEVVDNFVATYAQGQTPNPCVRCNNDIKFAALLDKTKELGGEFLATGHYARIKKHADGHYQLFAGVDKNKDQSYFLFGLSQEELAHVIFPLGEMTKPEARLLAKENGLDIFEKKDSQEICFVQSSYVDFVEKNITDAQRVPGKIINAQGEVLGFHTGIHQFTIGQRKGLGVQSFEPLYVIEISNNGDVLVGPKEMLLQKNVHVGELSWIHKSLQAEDKIKIKIRSRFEPATAIVKGYDEAKAMMTVEFDEMQESITPGQAAVFYLGDEIVGGGWIKP